MYTETCPDCLGVGTITHRKMLSVHMETVNCEKCKGKQVIKYKTSPESREYHRKRFQSKRVTTPVRWTPPEKIPEEYQF
jgi:DnaJ-class molecular chaperone